MLKAKLFHNSTVNYCRRKLNVVLRHESIADKIQLRTNSAQ